MAHGGPAGSASRPRADAARCRYLARLLEDGQTVEFFVEGTRSRSGKALEPRLGMLRMLSKVLLAGRVEDILLVPVSVDYERPLEVRGARQAEGDRRLTALAQVSLYADEMLGSAKPKESLVNMLRAAPRAMGQSFGKVSLQFSAPVSLRALLGERVAERAIGLRLLSSLEASSVCFTTHLVASLLLMYRHGATLEQLERASVWLRLQVEARAGHVVRAWGGIQSGRR
jgi:hypothetical protein